ncbi:aminodeoxychorismate/anthranilate synthase component II [Clostridium sp. AM58-1XD]|uniref:anthranilate synthase component II n=1 Tax=Clostridium sp. AM58-1XD TaxID=2292307 RepID=UPI000E4E071C|nr:aminodeoxychorismate/anthranilate synthase component II [Clostridium sp. AM58-1XD]RGZ00956.1 aminodeoxychorismate/anthranilate synthase component II [Clostridium sp. AM58-1XD]
MILLIDNYDSFSYNLYQLTGSLNPDIRVIRNDEMTVEEIGELNPEAIILSPGPGRPEGAGCCMDVVKKLGNKIPILGICLGHQAICEAFGGTVSYAKKLMHGKQSIVTAVGTEQEKSLLLKGLPEQFPAARYHSLAAVEESLPKELKVTARADDGEIMAVQHESYHIYGLQFHPESILTPDGKKMIENFLEVVKHD